MKKEPTLKQLESVMNAMKFIYHSEQTENFCRYYLELDKLILDKQKAESEALILKTKK